MRSGQAVVAELAGEEREGVLFGRGQLHVLDVRALAALMGQAAQPAAAAAGQADEAGAVKRIWAAQKRLPELLRKLR